MQDLIQRYQGCQWIKRNSKAPLAPLQPLPLVRPFAWWGLDIIGPFPTTKGNLRFVFVAIKYFSRWVEVESIAKITAAAAQRFVWRNIIWRYRVPRDIITDNQPTLCVLFAGVGA